MMKSVLKVYLITKQLKAFPLTVGCHHWRRKYSTNGKKSTLNEEEIHKFESFGATDWWTDRQFRPLLAMNELRVPFIRDTFKPSADASKPLKGIRLLEIGCGAGLLSEPLARLGAD